MREDLLNETNGPMLHYGIQEMHNRSIILPKSLAQRPDKDGLAMRFDKFRTAI